MAHTAAPSHHARMPVGVAHILHLVPWGPYCNLAALRIQVCKARQDRNIGIEKEGTGWGVPGVGSGSGDGCGGGLTTESTDGQYGNR